MREEPFGEQQWEHVNLSQKKAGSANAPKRKTGARSVSATGTISIQ